MLYIWIFLYISVERMKRSVLLQIDPTVRKRRILREFSIKATAEFNRLWKERDFCNRFMDFHRKVYSTSKTNTSFNVQIVCGLERSVWRSKGISKGITVKFNVPRNCKTFSTKSMDFVRLGSIHEIRFPSQSSKMATGRDMTHFSKMDGLARPMD